MITRDSPQPFKRRPLDLERFEAAIANQRLSDALEATWSGMEMGNTPLFIRLQYITGIVIAQQCVKRDIDESVAIGEAYRSGAIIAYYTLPDDAVLGGLPFIHGRTISNALREAPRAEDEELVWHFAIEQDDILRSILDKGMEALGHDIATTPAVYNGAGLVNYVFNSYPASHN